MENLPIDAISLPSRIFYSATEDKIYAGTPGNYKEVGGDSGLTAEDVSYNNTASELTADNVQDAIDEVVDIKENKGQQTTIKGTSSSAGPTTNKVVTLTDPLYEPQIDDVFEITFSNRTTSASMGLNINGTGIRSVTMGGDSSLIASSISGTRLLFRYNGETYECLTPTALRGNANSVYGRPINSYGLLSSIDISENGLLGRGTGNLSNITIGTGLEIDGSGNLNVTATGGITALTGDVTASGTGSVTATIPNGTVTNAKLANVPGFSVKGKATTGTGAVGDITLGTNTILGRGTGNIAPLSLDSSLQISGSTLQVNPNNDIYTKTHSVDLTITMAQFLALHTTQIDFPSLGLSGGESAFIENAVGEVFINITSGSFNPNPADVIRLAVYDSTGIPILGSSTITIQPISAPRHFVNQFHVFNYHNSPTTQFKLGTESAVVSSGTPTGNVRIRLYYKISNF